MALAGQIAIVTGASCGIGRGIALQLGEAGATVYVAGRKPEQSDAAVIDTLPKLEQVAKDITARGGKGIAAYVDHSNMDEVKEFFARVEREHNGQLGILVNNAYSAVKTIIGTVEKPFYECPPEIWDEINNVGLRNHYYCSVYAARLMANNRSGLIVNASSAGGLSVSYGVGKQALDRMSADMAVELKLGGGCVYLHGAKWFYYVSFVFQRSTPNYYEPFQDKNVCVVSIWPGAVRTELVTTLLARDKEGFSGEHAKIFEEGETTEYPGKAVVALACDDRRMEKTGRILITADMGSEYGRDPPNMRSLSFLLAHGGYKQAASMVPLWVKLPGWLLWGATSRL
ncbi:unnamed protein product [Heligmosomoides polygyrus]|uniref:NAD(P)-binding protein n=1 Tax=Heligmosomoides polygyrus TaxID=6339 RepID=A0A183GBR4_HELPZ|nr:unnamed protein product [Heligmosomoides polygyrus]